MSSHVIKAGDAVTYKLGKNDIETKVVSITEGKAKLANGLTRKVEHLTKKPNGVF